MGKLQSHMTSGIVSFLMPAAVVALDRQAEESPRMREVFAGRARLVHELLSAIDEFTCVPPTGAFYAFPDVSRCFGKTTAEGRTVESAGSFAEALLEEAKVAIVPGDDFGAVAANHVRISFACDEATFSEGIRRIAAWVSSLT
jgi:aspartate aminotransferase